VMWACCCWIEVVVRVTQQKKLRILYSKAYLKLRACLPPFSHV